LKPSNILVAADGAPRLLDFGIAKLTVAGGTAPEETSDKTGTVFQALTPEYASPEQVSGRSVTTASDIYSLGVILYELLTGHRPFRFRSKNAEEITRIITTTSPTKPSSICRIRGFNASISNPQAAIRNLRGDLDNIILMAMRKETYRRYSSVEQFAEDIRRYLAGLPVIARKDTFGYRASKFVKRNKAGVAAGVGIAFSLVGGLVAVSRQAKISARQRDKALREAEKAEKVNRFLQKMLASADPRAQGKDVKVIEVLGEAADSIENEFADQPEIAADLHTTIGSTYLVSPAVRPRRR
jgi:serine/threonine protein kinase